MTPFHYLVLGYSLIFAALAVYLLALGRRLRKVRGELDELRRRVDEGDENPGRR